MNITFIPGRSITLVTSKMKVLTAGSTHHNWKAIEQAVRARDEQALIEAISMQKTIENFGQTSAIEIRDGDGIYFHGEKLFGEDVNRIFSYLQGGFPHESMVKFLEAKLRNGFPESVNALYRFLENRGMPITANGTVLGYKGVERDYYSKNTGNEPLVQGKRDERGKILNAIGETIWMDRRYVCADNNQGCAGGLHIGSKQYATGWAGSGGRVMIVEFSPEHVVSVPHSEHEKLRVFKYRVVGELEGDFLGDVYNNNYVRPENEAPESVEVELSDEDLAAEHEVFAIEGANAAAEIPRTVPRNMYNVSDWSKGQAAGYKDGKGHQKRKFYEEDKGRKFKKFSKEFVDGYLVGYRDGRV